MCVSVCVSVLTLATGKQKRDAADKEHGKTEERHEERSMKVGSQVVLCEHGC